MPNRTSNPGRDRIVSLLKNVQIGSGAHTDSHSIDTVVLPGKGGWGKRPGCAVANSLQFSAELKNV